MATTDSATAAPDIVEDYRSLLDDDSRAPARSKMPRASEIGHDCGRYIALRMIAGDQEERFDRRTLGILGTGNLLEGPIIRRLDEAGSRGRPRWRLTRQQSPVTGRGMLKGHKLSGTCDAVIEVDAGGRWEPWAVCDLKTASPSVMRMRTVEDLREHRLFGRKWAAQLEVYAAGMGIPRCALLAVAKQNPLHDIKAIVWEPSEIDMRRWAERADEIYEAAQAASDNQQDYSLLPAGVNQLSTCSRCKLRDICNPILTTGDNIVEDPKIEQLIEARAALQDAKREYDRVDRELKKYLPDRELVICGRWAIEAQQVSRAGYTVQPSSYWLRKFKPMVPPGADKETSI